MKRFSLLMVLVLIFTLSACASNKTTNKHADTDTETTKIITDYGDTREYSDKSFGVNMTLPDGYSVGKVNESNSVRFFAANDGNTKVNIMWSDDNFDKFVEARKSLDESADSTVKYLVREELEINGKNAYRETFVRFNSVVPDFGEAHYIYYISENDRFLIIDFCESNGRVKSLDYEAPYDNEFLEAVKTLTFEQASE